MRTKSFLAVESDDGSLTNDHVDDGIGNSEDESLVVQRFA